MATPRPDKDPKARSRGVLIRLVGVQLVVVPLLVAGLSGCASHAPLRGEDSCVLRVGTSGDYPPFSFETAQPARAGLDIAIADRLASDLHCRAEYVPFTWPTLLAQIQRDDFDIALSGITMRPDRSLVAVFSRPYAHTAVVVIHAGTASFTELGDLNRTGTVLAVNRGGHLERWARRHLPLASLHSVTDNQSLPEVLLSGEVDGLVTDTAEANAWGDLGRVDLGNMLGPFSMTYKAVLINRRRADLVPRIDRWLVDREADGWLAARRTEYLGDGQVRDSRAAAMEALSALIRARLAMMPLVAHTKRAATAPVTDRGQERAVIERAITWSNANDSAIDGVFAILIDLAKRIQRRTVDDAPGQPLALLRYTIREIDRQLVREIDRIPPASAEEWRRYIAPATADLPLEPAEIDRLATTLSAAATFSD